MVWEKERHPVQKVNIGKVIKTEINHEKHLKPFRKQNPFMSHNKILTEGTRRMGKL